MLKRIFSYFNAASAQISAPELITVTLDLAIYIIYGTFRQHFYLWFIILLCDLLIIGSHGAWLKANGHPIHGPWRTPTPFVARCIAVAIIFIFTNVTNTDSSLLFYAWYIILIAAICHAFYSILLTLHQTNNSWLDGTQGRIGAPNWISILRIILSLLVPHLYIVQPFGIISSQLATAFLLVAIVTDAADGYIARRFNQMTKAGKALDPLGDKIIFYPTAIAFFISPQAEPYLNFVPRPIFYLAGIIMFARDLLFLIWFFIYYRNLKAGIGASLVDKCRMAIMCLCLAVMSFAMTLPDYRPRLAYTILLSLIGVAVLSIISVFVDYARIQNAPRDHS